MLARTLILRDDRCRLDSAARPRSGEPRSVGGEPLTQIVDFRPDEREGLGVGVAVGAHAVCLQLQLALAP